MPGAPALIAADFAASLANTAAWIWRDRTDRLPDIQALTHLLSAHELPITGLTELDVARARDLRPRLRAPFEAVSDTECVEAINAVLALLGPTPRIKTETTGLSIQLHCPSGLTIDNAVATSAHALAQTVIHNGRQRLHHCAAPSCQGVFIDTTRNHSRRFCMPELCGNRTNVAAYRRRNQQR